MNNDVIVTTRDLKRDYEIIGRGDFILTPLSKLFRKYHKQGRWYYGLYYFVS